MRGPLCLALYLTLASTLPGQEAGLEARSSEGARSSQEARWREDIDAFVRGVSAEGTTVDLERGISSRGRKDFGKLYPREKFDPAIASLKQSLPTLSDAEIVVRLMQIVASAGVAHNGIDWPKGMGFEQRIPFTFGWFADGLAVTAATRPFAKTIGLRVLRIGSMTPPELLEGVSPFISHENQVWLRLNAPVFITLHPVLEHLGLIEPDGLVSVTLARPGSEPMVVRVPLVDSKEPKIGFWEALHISKPPYVSQLRKNYWHQYLEDSQTAYIQYNACANDRALSFADFTRDVVAEDIDRHPVKRVVVDLRWNGGGDSRVISPLKKALASRPNLAGHIYVLIGPNTFSSALYDAVEWKRDLRVTLVGEPTGGKPSGSYGEVNKLTLPNSRLVVRYTSKYFGGSTDMDAPSLMPDIAAPLALGDLMAGRDPALSAVLEAK